MNQLARNPGQLNRVIQQLHRQVTLPAGESEQGVPKADLQSSNIYGFQYDPRTKMLRVRFNSGSIYEYGGIPPQIFKAFKAGAVPAKTTGQNQWGAWWTGKVPSLGATFYELIRQREFPYRKVA
jgi:hypothetical protein